MEKTVDTREASSQLADALHRLMPFHYFYEKAGKPLPDFTFLEKSEMPYPYRSMLVHENDMTPTLAAFHHSKLYLEVHQHERTDNYLMRLVTLHAVTDNSPVEYGAIGIHLDGFPPEVSQLIIEGEIPLGGILGEYGVRHSGSPTAFFSVPADDRIATALKQEVGETLYGRCNQLLDDDGMAIADIVEILPRHCESEKWIENVK
ncbi:MAG: hypothetical protein P1V20_02325 [Verrucomicrobiales bacterium]|nr:hypothetical protein [Verrucomicrobiales bacterium]